jgi:cytochrome c biogenesis protein CcmG/thiol:disulfide interchange protein DsbE
LRGEVSVVNVFASWCVPCRVEHPLIQRLATVVPVHGINYKDQPEQAARWLAELGDPYTRTGADLDGRVAIDWGVYGIPETFVIDRDGRIVYKQIGPIPPDVLEEKLLPLIRKLQKQKDAD